MRLQVLVGELLEVIEDLLLDDWCQTLHLLNQDALVHLELADAGGARLLGRLGDLSVYGLLERVLLLATGAAERLIAPLGLQAVVVRGGAFRSLS